MFDRETSLPWLGLFVIVASTAALLGDMVLPRAGHALVLCVKQTKNPDRPKTFFRARKCPRVAEGATVSPDGTVQQFVLPGAFTCWDKNQNGRCDLATEDTNGVDGCTNADCGGIQCWDLNGNLTCDAATEDRNGVDGCTIDDCRGTECWDTNRNGSCDAAENVDASPGCTISDCAGPQGPTGLNGMDGLNGTDGVNGMDGINGVDGVNGMDGINGIDGVNGIDGINGIDGANGADGLACWDLDASGACDNGEDVNGGGCDATDCKGADGVDGVNGTNGVDGVDGQDGLPCWDLNASGSCDNDEDRNGGGCDASDCQGESRATSTDGEDGAIPDTGTGGLSNLAAGSYMLLAKGTLTNGTAASIDVDCDLLGDADAVLDTTTVTVRPGERVLALVQDAAVVNGGAVKLRCNGGQPGDITMGQIVVSAILVGNVTNAVCGDGAVNRIQETCDDGNTDGGDGCSSTCESE